MSKTLGRFNFLTVKSDIFEVIYKPIFGDTMTIVAKDLSRDEAVSLMSELNSVIDDFRHMSFKEFQSEVPTGEER